VDPVREFYNPFAELVKKAEAEMPEQNMGPEPMGGSARNVGMIWYTLGAILAIYQLQQFP